VMRRYDFVVRIRRYGKGVLKFAAIRLWDVYFSYYHFMWQLPGIILHSEGLGPF